MRLLTSMKTEVHLAAIGFEVLIHLPYHPDLTPSDGFVLIFEERAGENSMVPWMTL